MALVASIWGYSNYHTAKVITDGTCHFGDKLESSTANIKKAADQTADALKTASDTARTIVAHLNEQMSNVTSTFKDVMGGTVRYAAAMLFVTVLVVLAITPVDALKNGALADVLSFFCSKALSWRLVSAVLLALVCCYHSRFIKMLHTWHALRRQEQHVKRNWDKKVVAGGIIRSGDRVDSITLWTRSGEIFLDEGGRGGSSVHMFNLDKNEHIVQVFGQNDDERRMARVGFKTNHGRTVGPFGCPESWLKANSHFSLPKAPSADTALVAGTTADSSLWFKVLTVQHIHPKWERHPLA